MSMTSIPAIDALPLLDRMATFPAQTPNVQSPGAASFAQMLVNGVDKVNSNVIGADKMVRAFTLDDSIPVHQVTFALEQARLSMELMLQMRNRLIEGYQQLMNMQL